MTRVDFYLTQDLSAQQRNFTACRLIEKVFRLGHHVYIHTDDDEQAKQLDDLLWTFHNISFVPHCCAEVNSSTANYSKVVIGQQHHLDAKHDVLINLASEIPVFFTRFERVAEIVGGQDVEREASRERFRFYRDRGYALETHQLTK